MSRTLRRSFPKLSSGANARWTRDHKPCSTFYDAGGVIVDDARVHSPKLRRSIKAAANRSARRAPIDLE